jgi:dynein heavy chain, axonemal
MGFTKKTIQF